MAALQKRGSECWFLMVSTFSVALSWDGGQTYTSAQTTPTLGDADVVYTVGSSTDLWGRGSWEPADFEPQNFRVRVTASPDGNTIFLDGLEVRVHNREAEGSGSAPGRIP